MKNLQNFGVQELNTVELIKIDGGKIPWRKLKKWGGKLMEWAGVYDAIDDFTEGFAEANCE